MGTRRPQTASPGRQVAWLSEGAEQVAPIASNVQEHRDPAAWLIPRGRYKLHPLEPQRLGAGIEVLDTKKEPDPTAV